MAGMAENQEARGAQQLGAALDENLAPAMGAHPLPELRRRAGDDHPTLVKLGQGVAQ
jgi:hypothetical protein